MSLVISHGNLFGVVGQPRCSDGVWFVPARADIEGPEESASHLLQDYAQVSFDCEGDFELGDADGIWVRAVIPGVFRYAPLHVADGRWFLLDAAFFAVLLDAGGSGVAYPFACTDADHATGLVFSRLGPGAEVRDRIAQGFWGLLVVEGANRLSEFSAGGIGFDTGDGYDTEIEVGYSQGRFYAHDLRDSPE